MARSIMAACVVILAAGMLVPARAEAQSYEALKPLLVDLAGWEAEAAQGTSMDMEGAKMTTATREYKQGEKQITVTIVIGGAAAAAANAMATATPVQAETDKDKVSVQNLDGFQVTSNYDKQEKSGTILVILAQAKDGGAFMTFTYNGLNDGEAMKLAQKFDWKKMHAAATKK